ncbi:MAG: hypothetical protein M3N93_02185 [Acidobacteriota bacterium]|nr:hypothetical protein [Acidobacteriota bacterium]
MKADPTETALAALDTIPLHTPEGRGQMAKALASRSNLIAAKAARIIVASHEAESHWADLKDDLVRHFERFLARGAELDKGCSATTAIARALFHLDYDAPDLFLKGMRHVQLEPVWGKPIDTAAELRGVCAMGLIGTRLPNKLRLLVDLLADTEWQARAGAVRAIAAEGSDAAALLLRLKTLTGDEAPEVLSDCFTGLLALEGPEAMPIVTRFVTHGDAEICETALLALGTSRRADAVEFLRNCFFTMSDPRRQSCILLALSTSRTDAAIEFVLKVIGDENPALSALAISAMEIHRDDGLRARVEAARRSIP